MTKRSQGKAFTLVELLVVIGIIALLISILLPTLNKAREQAKITVCTTQVREVANATIMRAAEKRGAMPMYRGQKAGAEYKSGAGDSQISFIIASDDQANAYPDPFTGDLGDEGAGVGQLVKEGYLKSRKIMVCPSMVETLFINNKDRAGYYFNPWPALRSGTASVGGPLGGGGSAGKLTTRFKKLKDFRKELPLLCEVFYDYGNFPHVDRRTGLATFNVVYADGHAVSVKSKRATDNLKNRGGWNWNRVCDTISMAGHEGMGIGGPNAQGLTKKENPGTLSANAVHSDYWYSFYPMVP